MQVEYKTPTLNEIIVPGTKYEFKHIYTLDSEDVSKIGIGSHKDHFIEKEFIKDGGQKYYWIAFWGEYSVSGNGSFMKAGSIDDFNEWAPNRLRIKVCSK